MMPDLGKYAFAVLASYGVGLGLIVILVVASVLRARKVRAELEQIEQRSKRHG
ncbi:heme exporter protein CcmD [Citreicella sp. SE45]|jgi:heme exporter protein D|uniref:Heme exporter protein D n=1 Tax=Salipiger thiooxidans TaxID=282683 RepID=A0A1G7H6Y5_9RHOB|nr:MULTISPECIES: heme exporter protein CcmD [Salipiger]EEX14866.1 heme exporter protein CcmD [Citreicella sp. SE45]SDE96024.1 heme exporter protein D [Salipiger thiooxidans]